MFGGECYNGLNFHGRTHINNTAVVSIIRYFHPQTCYERLGKFYSIIGKYRGLWGMRSPRKIGLLGIESVHGLGQHSIIWKEQGNSTLFQREFTHIHTTNAEGRVLCGYSSGWCWKYRNSIAKLYGMERRLFNHDNTTRRLTEPAEYVTTNQECMLVGIGCALI